MAAQKVILHTANLLKHHHHKSTGTTVSEVRGGRERERVEELG